MARKITVSGNPARTIEVTGKPQRRIEPEEFAAALGAEPIGDTHSAGLDPIALAELGTQMLNRLRSSGGRPALADATEICRVPLSAEDLMALETITADIEQSTGTKPSVGQVVGVIVREYLTRRPPYSAAQAMAKAAQAPVSSITSWLPRLAEIASKASTVHQSASTLEAAVKQIKKEMEAGN